MTRSSLFVVAAVLGAASPVAHAHFALEAPPAYSVQDATGMPQKSPPCGQADPSYPLVATNVVTDFHAGDTITITIDEKVFHPGHYRVALAADQASLPADPNVTANASSPCGTADVQDSSTPGVIADNQLPHTAAFSGPQSFQVTLPAGMTCTNCTLQVIEFMSNHTRNNPGGCFYHHCAQVNLVPPGTALPDAGTTAGKSGGGCAVDGEGGAALALLAVVLALTGSRRAS
jgi:MYXO-CTERM domain-containing protein